MAIRTGHVRAVLLTAACLTAWLGFTPAHALDLPTLAKSGTASGDIRLRFEQVKDDGFRIARAATLRTRLGYRVGRKNGLQLFGEFEHVAIAGADRYGVPGQPNPQNRASVGDPTGTEVNQIYLQYGGGERGRFRWGRQRIVQDNGRHIGNEGWRQREQTFDGFRFTTNVDGGAGQFSYAYLWNSNTVLGNDFNLAAHLLNLTGPAGDGGRMSAYAHLVEFTDAPGNSAQTYGTRFEGVYPASGATFKMRGEYANQRDYKATSFQPVDYRLVELEMNDGHYVGVVTAERLDGSSTRGFQMPLGTSHAFNGWADLFLTTPVTGLRDLAFTLRSKVKSSTLSVIYHGFSSADGTVDYGSEWDVLLAGPFREGVSYGIKMARYKADTFATDRTLMWAWLQTGF